MPWVRIDQNAMDHPKVAGLPGETFKLWVQGLAHCQKFLTDGRIDSVSLRWLRGYSAKRAAELLAARLWLAAEDGVSVHDYLDWNDSREHVEKIRSQGRERIKRLRNNAGSNAGSNAVTAREQRANAMGVLCVSSELASSSTERGEGGTGETRPAMRAGDFCEWYADTHSRLVGVGYIGNPRKDYESALLLVAKFTDAELQDAAIVWFGQRDPFAVNGTRTVTKFASRASALVVAAREVTA